MENIVQFLVSDKSAATRVVQILHHLSAESLLSVSDTYLVRRDKNGKVIFTEAFNLPTDEAIWNNTADPMTMVKTPFDFLDATFSGDDTGSLSDLTLSERVAQSLPYNKMMIMCHLTESDLSMHQLQSRLQGIAEIKRISLDVSSNGGRTVNDSAFFTNKKPQKASLLKRQVASSSSHEFNQEVNQQQDCIKQDIRKMEDESAVTPWQEQRDPLSDKVQSNVPLPQAHYKVENSITPQDIRNIHHVSKQKVEKVVEQESLKERVAQGLHQMSNSIDEAASRFNNREGFSFFERLLMFFGFTPARVRTK